MKPRFKIGQKFIPRGKDVIHTIIDIHTTRNTKDEVVKLRYVTEHEFCGQKVRNFDTVDATIARAVNAEKLMRDSTVYDPDAEAKELGYE